MTRKEKVIYLAGIFDGEGCIGLYQTRSKTDTRSPHYQILLRVTQKSPLAVELLLEIFGGKIHTYTDVGPNKPGPYFAWRVTDKTAEDTIKELYPYLREKRTQADTVLAFQQLRREQRKYTYSAPLSQSMLDERKKYVDLLKEQKHPKWELTYFN